MNVKYSDRAARTDFPTEFTTKVLAAANDPNLISFSGGLPNPGSFPVEELRAACNAVIDKYGFKAFQYNSTQGLETLRKHICDRYKKTMNLDFDPSEIVITNGSQQAFDILSTIFLNPGDEMMVEDPTYLGALQSFHLYDPVILPVELQNDGINVEALAETVKNHNPKFMYIIPNFQNPTGLTYTEEKRAAMAEVLKGTDVFVVEDNPYGELRFEGVQPNSLAYYLPEQAILLGTFSKTAAPGFRIGWIATKNKDVMDHILAIKSTKDLHTNSFSQMVLDEYLSANDFDAHLVEAKALYKQRFEMMLGLMEKYLPEGIEFTKPQGGMFIWVTLPEGVKAVDVQNAALKKGVAVIAGDPFYEYERNVRTMRVNYSNCTDEQMENGVKALAETIKEFM